MRTIFDHIAWLWWWRGRYPRTVEDTVQDFLENRNSSRVLQSISSLPENAREDSDATLALCRRIEVIYGLRHGWNRNLLRACGTRDPEEAAKRVFDVFWKRVRSGATAHYHALHLSKETAEPTEDEHPADGR